VIFLAIAFAKNLIITGADNGKLYIWRNYKLVTYVNAHKGAVNCLEYSDKDSNILISAGIDGTVKLWKIEYKFALNQRAVPAQIVHMSDFSLLNDKSEPLSDRTHIQAICIGGEIGSHKILVGNKIGEIFEIVMGETPEQSSINRVMRANDDEVIISVSCDPTSHFLFTLSRDGLFTIWDIQCALKVLYTKYFHKKGVEVLAFQT